MSQKELRKFVTCKDSKRNFECLAKLAKIIKVKKPRPREGKTKRTQRRTQNEENLATKPHKILKRS